VAKKEIKQREIKTVLCFTTYFKGVQFMKTCKELGCKVILITSKKLEHKEWPRESLDEIFYISDDNDNVNMDNVMKGIAYIKREHKFDIIVALDDYDVERAAHIREEFRVPGMGQTTARHFRDKLAMRMQAQDSGLLVPAFSDVFNNDTVKDFISKNPAPWVLKPRSAASAIGIKKITSADQLWQILDSLGDRRFQYLLEQFVPGDVYHVDALTNQDKVIFARAHQYMNTPMEVAHEGGVFRSHTVTYSSEDDKALLAMNEQVLKAFGLRRGASHTEFIKAHADDRLYFLETSARVGGANIVEMLEASSGLNLWAEWAKAEILQEDYKLPKINKDYSGIIVSLAKQLHPDTSAYNDPEICWRMDMEMHAGLIVRSKKLDRIKELLNQYASRFYTDFFAKAPARESPPNPA
jgi:biotin carboxylase